MVAINNLYMTKIPNSCKECPLTYLDTGDDAYFGACERRCVIDDSCVDGMGSERAYDCPLVEAIPKDQYEARLKADMVAILEDLDLKIDEMYEPQFSKEGMDGFYWAQGLFKELVQEEINALKEAADDQSGAG